MATAGPASPIIEKSRDAGRKTTPIGASPPAPGWARMVFSPAVVPSVQQAPARPVAPVSEIALAPKMPHVPDLAATLPFPAVTLQVTGTFASSVPKRVRTTMNGSHSADTVLPTVAAAHGSATMLGRFTGVPFLIGSGAPGAGTRMNSVTVPPTPPPNSSSGSTGANGLNSVTVPPTPPPNAS